MLKILGVIRLIIILCTSLPRSYLLIYYCYEMQVKQYYKQTIKKHNLKMPNHLLVSLKFPEMLFKQSRQMIKWPLTKEQ